MIIETLDILEPTLPSSLFSEDAVRGIRHLAVRSAPIARIGFECRLATGEKQVDLFQAVFKEEGEHHIFLRHLASTVREGARHPAWSRLFEFVQEWCNPSTVSGRGVAEVWLEYDISDPDNPENVPSLFVDIDRTKLDPAVVRTLAEGSVERLWGRPLSDRLRQNFRTCLGELPDKTRFCSVAVMLSRQIDAIRFHVRSLDVDEIPAYLAASGWAGDESAARETLNLLAGYCDEIRLDLDVGDAVHRQLGLNGYIARPPDRDNRWRALLEHLVDRGLCDADKKEAVLDWPGYTSPPFSENPWPAELLVKSLVQTENVFGVLARTLNHVKIFIDPMGRTSAKAYLGYGHTWVSAPGAPPHQSRKTTRTE